MSDAVTAARLLGERVAQQLNIPVYFYEEAATRPERQNLEAIRRKGFEELRDAIRHDAERHPDLGPAEVHPSAGAVVVGARGPLIAYNIYLNSDDVRIAKAIAKAIRHSSGGLRYVKALGLEIPARGQVQVSMNLTNYRKSAMHTVFEMVRSIADSHGAAITDSEVVGLVPMEALVDSARFYLRMHDFASDQILESKLLEA
jgi:glutamate formiminotransferase